jgi:DNA-binding LacI/PurR family transcriptional regulator
MPMSMASLASDVQSFASLDEVARACGVSKATASRALSLPDDRCPLNPHTRDRVREQAKLMGYRPNLLAVSLSRSRTSSADSTAELIAIEIDVDREDFSPGSDVVRRIRQAIAQGQKPVLMAVQPVEQKIETSDWKADASWD